MAQRVDLSQYFTRRQLLAYLDSRSNNAALPPQNVTVTGTGVYDTGVRIVAYIDLAIIDAAKPDWCSAPEYVQGYQFNYSYQAINGTVSDATYLARTADGFYRLGNLPPGVELDLAVRTVDFAGQVSPPVAVADIQLPVDSVAPAQPVIAAIPVLAGVQVTVDTYNNEPDFDAYELWRQRDGDVWTFVFRFLSTSVLDSNIAAAGNYYYKVIARDFSGNPTDGSSSNVVGPITVASTNSAPPPTVDLANGSVTANPDGTLALAWPALNDPALTFYRVWRKRRVSAGPDVWEEAWTLVATLSAQPGVAIGYTDYDTVSGARYRYAVTALNVFGDESAFPATVLEETAQDVVAPPKVIEAALNGRLGGIDVVWTPTGAALYRLNWRFTPLSAWTQTSDVLVYGNSYSILGLTTSKDVLANQFQVRIVAQDGNGNQSDLPHPVFTVDYPSLANYRPADDSMPACPLTLLADNTATDGSVTLSWPASVSPDRTGYQVEIFDSLLNGWEPYGVLLDDRAGVISYRVENLEPYKFRNKQYRFRVRTTDASGNISQINLFENPSFTSGMALWAGAANLVAGRSGQGVSLSGDGNVHQDVVVQPGAFYTLSAYVKEDTAGAGAYFELVWLRANDTQISTVTSATLATTNNFARLVGTFQAPADAVKARVYLRTSLSTDQVIWDDLQFEQGAGATAYGDSKTELIRVVDATAPGAYVPLDFDAKGGLGMIRLTWKNPVAPNFAYIGAVFEVYRKVTDTGGQSGLTTDSSFVKVAEIPANPDGALNSYEDLTPEETYYVTASYELYARDRWGNRSVKLAEDTATSGTLNEQRDTVAPAEPDLGGGRGTIVSNDDGSITIGWQPNAEADLAGYIVLRRLAGQTDFNVLATVNAIPDTPLSYTDSGLTLGQAYHYTIAAFDKSNNVSTYTRSQYLVGTSADSRQPAPPTELVAVGAVGRLDLRWKPSTSPGVSTYEVVVPAVNGIVSGSSWEVAGTSTQLPLILGPYAEWLSQVNPMVRAVRIVDEAGTQRQYSTWANLSQMDTFNYVPVDKVPPEAPGKPAPVSLSPDMLVLGWGPSASRDIARYVVEVQIAGGWYTVGQGVDTSSGCVISGLTQGQSYVFRVTAIDNSNYKAFSPVSDPITVPTTVGSNPAPDPVTISSVTTGLEVDPTKSWCEVNWTQSNAGDFGRYEIRINADNNLVATVTNITTLKFRFGQMTNGTTYSFEVRVVDTGGAVSAWSAAVEQTTPATPSQPAAPTVALTRLVDSDSGGTYGCTIKLNFSGTIPADFVRFNIYIGNAETGPWTLMATWASTNQYSFYMDGGMVAKTYYWQVESVTATGTVSARSNTVSAIVPKFVSTDPECYSTMMFLNRNALVGQAEPGMPVCGVDDTLKHKVFWPIKSVRFAVAHCITLRTANGAAVTLSVRTPVPVNGGEYLWAGQVEPGQKLLTEVGKGLEWSECVASEDAGEIPVAYISLGEHVYRAGLEPGKWIYTHNSAPSSPIRK